VVKDAAQDSFVEKLIANVIKNLEVTVTNIHVRFEDSTTNPKKPFSVGVTLRELSLRVCLVIAVYWSFPYFFFNRHFTSLCEHDTSHISGCAPCCGVIVAAHLCLLLLDASYPLGTQQQTCCMPLLLTNNGTDRWTD